jgi:hypothetical protein
MGKTLSDEGFSGADRGQPVFDPWVGIDNGFPQTLAFGVSDVRALV